MAKRQGMLSVKWEISNVERLLENVIARSRATCLRATHRQARRQVSSRRKLQVIAELLPKFATQRRRIRDSR